MKLADVRYFAVPLNVADLLLLLSVCFLSVRPSGVRLSTMPVLSGLVSSHRLLSLCVCV